MVSTIVTTTFYKSREDVRFECALATAEAARDLGHKLVVVDGSPERWVQDAFEERHAIVLREAARGMGASRRQALQAALDDSDKGDVFVWIEPEKYPLVPLLGAGLAKVTADGIDMVLPRRDNLDSYPQYQQFCELRGNWQVGNLTGRPDLDFWFGPRVMNRRATEYFTGYNGEYGDRWDSIFVPVARALAAGLRVESVVVDYVHPPQQTAAEAGDETMDRKRDQQLAELVEAMRTECNRLGLPRR